MLRSIEQSRNRRVEQLRGQVSTDRDQTQENSHASPRSAFERLGNSPSKCLIAGGGVPGHAGEQRARGLRAGGAERDGSVLLCADRKAAARQVEPSRDGFPARCFGSGRHNLGVCILSV